MKYETRSCKVHGVTRFKCETYNKKGDTRWRCVACGVARGSKAVRKLKERLVIECGGRCRLCGYDRCIWALEFHHLDPNKKKFKVSLACFGYKKKLEEAKKCILLCSNCHREVEHGMVTIDGVCSVKVCTSACEAGVSRTRGERMKNEFCVVVKDANGVPHFVSAVHTQEEARKLRDLLAEGEVVPAEEGRRYKEQITQQEKKERVQVPS